MSALAFSSFPELDGERVPCVGVISGNAFDELDRVTYLIETDPNGESRAFEIRYDMRCSPFQEALKVGSLLAVGHEAHFYLFDTSTMKNVLALPVEGYFGHLYYDGGRFYVAGCYELYCIAPSGQVIWKSEGLGIDGVIVEAFDDQRISGAGEWDPPDGWRPFVIDRSTGKKVDL